eukprot:CAMPEP_0198290808 /NCGR_PEP_ID=MMETSP1449-20131203/8539_1 /TAXON_ID=420275 /ORGANISM="Attheya septentrionalis, Strain CCMP2084" /LENGTH=326 /DNA_ID=CAMNT_0043989357 /DNA_START=47 /DNA_END=1027 /DNA_ORIENTATION=+
MGLTVVITGSSQGVGLEAAKILLTEGHTVIHACRNQERAQVAADGAGGGIPLVCDLADFSSIRAFAATLKASPYGKIDVLCLNAGMSPSPQATTPKLTKDGYEECIGTNHLGHFLLANLLQQDQLVEGARIVVTASSIHDPKAPGGNIGGINGATLGDLSGLGIRLDREPNNDTETLPVMIDGSMEYSGTKVYKDSKLCNILFCREALKRWGGVGIKVRSFSPGFIPTSGLFRVPREQNWIKVALFASFMRLLGVAVPVEVGGARMAYMVTSNDDEIPSGSFVSAPGGSRAITKADGFQDHPVSEEAQNDALASQLWEASAKVVGL